MRKFSKNIALLMALVMLAAVIPTAVADEDDGSGDIMPMSLQPLEEIGTERDPIEIDLTDLKIDELDRVPIRTILEKLNEALLANDLGDKVVDVENSTMAWVKRYQDAGFGQRDNYKLPGEDSTIDLDTGYKYYELSSAVRDTVYGGNVAYYNYAVSPDDLADLEYYYSNDPSCVYLLMIVGENAADQTASNSRRFVVKALLPQENHVLSFTTEGTDNENIPVIREYSDMAGSDTESYEAYYVYFGGSHKDDTVDLKIKFKDALGGKYTDLRVFRGDISTPDDEGAEELTDNICAGVEISEWDQGKFTAFYTDANGEQRVHHFELYIFTTDIYVGYSITHENVRLSRYNYDYGRDEDTDIRYRSYTFELKEGQDIDAESTVKLSAINDEFPNQPDVENIKAAYLGFYRTEEEAQGQTDIKEQLFGDDGYTSAGFKDGVKITVIDINDEFTYFMFTVTPYTEPATDPEEPEPSSENDFEIRSVYKSENGASYQAFSTCTGTQQRTDTMKDIYQTVFILGTEDEIKAESDGMIYPVWTASRGAKVTWADEEGGAAEERISGESALLFEPGKPKLITVIAENEDKTNYYVTFVAQQPEAELYVLGEGVQDSNYDEELQIPGREVHLADLERTEAYYDIMFANIGATPLTGISVHWEGEPKNVAIDGYWTVTENSSLGAFDSTASSGLRYGVADNIAKIRLIPAYGEDGKLSHGVIDGILVIETAEKTVKIKISGIAGTPKIVTETLKDQDAVRWVPYGAFIQSNNVSKTQVMFELDPYGNEPPAGIELSSSGALYGVPLAGSGTYEFTVQLVYYAGGERNVIDARTYELEVMDNTDDAVWNETDENYDVIRYIGTEYGDYHFVITSWGDAVFSSNGSFDEFVAFYLDGVRLTLGEDYDADPGSTVITIFDETIDSTDDGQTHTIAAEFRTDGTTADEAPQEEIKRAAQNYTIEIEYDEPEDDYTPDPPTTPTTPSKPTTPSEPDEPESKPFTFTDVVEGDWDYEEVKWAYEKDWMLGVSDTAFDPDSPVSQAIIVTVLARMQGVDLTKYDGVSYPGIPEGQWYTNAAIWAKQAGLLPDVDFTENMPTERGRMAVMLVKYLRSMGVDVSAPAEPYEFKDASDMTDASLSAFQALYKLGIFKGIGDMYMAPLSNTSRSEFATLIHRIANITGNAK